MLAGADWPENGWRQKAGCDGQGVCGVTWACTNDWNGQAVGVELGAIWGDEANTILASLWGSISRSGAC
jgi:hypothetical protein